jgi:hypothetical protein
MHHIRRITTAQDYDCASPVNAPFRRREYLRKIGDEAARTIKTKGRYSKGWAAEYVKLHEEMSCNWPKDFEIAPNVKYGSFEPIAEVCPATYIR